MQRYKILYFTKKSNKLREEQILLAALISYAKRTSLSYGRFARFLYLLPKIYYPDELFFMYFQRLWPSPIVLLFLLVFPQIGKFFLYKFLVLCYFTLITKLIYRLF